MKLSSNYSYFGLVSILVVCLLMACGKQTDLETIQIVKNNSIVEGSSSPDDVKEFEEEYRNGTISVHSMALDSQTDLNQYILYLYEEGSIVCTKQIQLEAEEEAFEDTYIDLVQTLVSYMGYEIIVHNIYFQEDYVVIDLSKESCIFQKENYTTTTNGLVCYDSYDEMVYGILDSIWTTIRKNYSESIDVTFLEDGETISMLNLETPIALAEGEAYLGSSYYKESYIQRSEGELSNYVTLGMQYNDAILVFHENGIVTRQAEDFSMLGDYTQYDTFQTADDFLRHAWIKIILETDDYSYIFDGEQSYLSSIYVKNKKVRSRRELAIGDKLNRLIELYGNDYSTYLLDSTILYEYKLVDCYFQVFFDVKTREVTQFGVSLYSESDELMGEELFRKLEK